MDVSAAGSIPVSVESVLAAKQEKVAGEVQMGMMKKGLDLQKDLMTQLLQEMGIGQSLDIRV